MREDGRRCEKRMAYLGNCKQFHLAGSLNVRTWGSMVRRKPGEVGGSHILESLDCLLLESSSGHLPLSGSFCTLRSLQPLPRTLPVYWPSVFPHCLRLKIWDPLHASGASVHPHVTLPEGHAGVALFTGGLGPPGTMPSNIFSTMSSTFWFCLHFLDFSGTLSPLASIPTPKNLIPLDSVHLSFLGFLSTFPTTTTTTTSFTLNYLYC